ncbi:DUF1129 domain-containing protein [Streptococcus macacae]|uniref:PF06570 family protein n=1 Tax=Streptococcus macacae NCTC 11558 TaxID=764298 RepID=G5JXG5_9STRE|nr:DUF1129 family protein [Streptococcus macacae]EHJ52700.1 hypothetical protein STRMA_1321 [Streptococcus macacae NCTC 11558]SUN79236.1 membrane protein [Streptococcus macacae NCTC 11558]
MDLQDLTKKNQDFINIATHQLMQNGKTDEDIKIILEDVLPDILEHQKKGIPARSFLGAPTAFADQFITESKEPLTKSRPKNTNPWLMWLDTSLLFLAIITIATGLMNFFSKQSPTYGLITLLILGLGGGAVMFASYYFIYRHSGKPKDERPSLFKSFGLLIVFMIFWMFLYVLTAFLPAAINPKIPDIALIVIAAVAFGLRYYLKKKYNTENAFSPQPSSN